MRSFPVLSLASILLATSSFAQLHDNVFRNSNNEHYWQNRMPDKAYWQQDVAYKIDARMNEDEDRIEGQEELTYWNNSPDTLTYVYFHLYQNAFIKGSHLGELEKLNKVPPGYGKREAAGLGIVIDNVQAGGQNVRTELDNTIMKVYLDRPLLPGSKVVLKMGFTTYYDKGQTRRRMKMYDAWGFKHYNGCQWFPKVSVYDRMHGWDTYQHLNKEFYGDYGVYDVTLDFPSNYVLEASGELQNRNEVLPADLRARLDISNFKDKKWDEAPSVITPYVKGERKKWHYIANNVHDFAFTGDPSYRIGTAYWNGVECVAIVQEPHAARWQNAPEYITKIIKTFSEDIGMYRYPKIVAADAADGMEYPMITMDGGAEPGYRGLLVHEIGHNWFYGQVGSNETYRAAMDEGFTQFLTAWGLRRIDGDTVMGWRPHNRYKARFAEPTYVLDRNVSNSYINSALNQNEVPLNTHSDDFHNALNHGGGYGTVYYKTANMLYNLQYVLGDTLFQQAMHHYFEQWKFAHPYYEDFRASIIQYTHVDLSWFFDEWFETVKPLDYAVGRIHHKDGDSYSIRFKRKGDMQMPLDVTITSKDGSKYNFHIPNTWFVKNTNATVLPKWTGWGKLNPTYTATVNVPGGIRSVQIDTSYRLSDRDEADNFRKRGTGLGAVVLKFDGGVSMPADRRAYRAYIRPDLWWNPVDGIKAGVHFEGDYFNTMNKLDATVWLNTHVLQADSFLSYTGDAPYKKYAPVNYSLNYISPVSRNYAKLAMQINSRFLDGIWYQRGGLNWSINDKNLVQGYALSMWRHDVQAADYLLSPQDWTSTWTRPNTSINLSWTHSYNYMRGAGRYTLSVRAPFLNGNNLPSNYSYFQLESVNTNMVGKLEVRTRLFGRYGMGNRFPGESLLYLAGASPEELLDNKYTRSIGFVPDDWRGIDRYDVNHFQQGGGLNLRGYAGYNAPDDRNGVNYESYKGRSGASANVEIGFENYLPYRPRLFRNWLHVNTYLFADAGLMQLSTFSRSSVYTIVPTNMWSDVRVDAGLGLAFTIKNWGVFEKAKPLTLRVDLPVFLNRAPYNNTQYLAARYVIGINRAF
jgi:hypothetical protein